MKIEKYSRTELTKAIETLTANIDDIRTYLKKNPDMPEAARTAIDKEIFHLEVAKKQAIARREQLVSRCIFCQKVSEVEVQTISHICVKCDERMNKAMGR